MVSETSPLYDRTARDPGQLTLLYHIELNVTTLLDPWNVQSRCSLAGMVGWAMRAFSVSYRTCKASCAYGEQRSAPVAGDG